MRNHILLLILSLALFVTNIYGDQQTVIQLSLLSKKHKYKVGEPVELKYEVLWLGSKDGEIYFNSTAFPELEILYLNQWRLELQNSEPIKIRKEPGRNEIRTFAPTMNGSSKTFVINSKEKPVTFLNGIRGYFLFEKNGTYVIRAKFDNKSLWKLSKDQKATIWSNSIVIEINS